MPKVARTAGHKRLTKRSRDLRRPLCSLEIAWNTGVTIRHPDAAALVLLAEYTNSVLFDRVREESGDAYSPEASFDLCDCAGVFDIYLKTTKDPRRIEKRVLERCKERLELSRRRNRRRDDLLLASLSECTRYGIAIDDLDVQSVTVSGVKSAAERYLPAYHGAYIRLAELGTG
jgi:hypothetical protein